MICVEHHASPSRQELLRAVAALRAKGRGRARPHDLSSRDPAFIEAIAPLMGLFYDRYFRCETELVADFPEGPVLAVANHNGMTGTPDMFCHMVAFWRRAGVHRLAHGLMHDFPFRTPWAGPWLNACGAIAANHVNARAALDGGAMLLVFPGGDIDACRPYRDRYRLQFAGRRGFLRLALRAGVPILPIVSVGAHSSLYLYSDGRHIAKALRLPMLFRSNVFPIGFALPYGPILGTPFPHLPPPVKVHTRVLAPIDLDMPASAADDPEAIEHAYARVAGPMQTALDELAQQGRHGLFPR